MNRDTEYGLPAIFDDLLSCDRPKDSHVIGSELTITTLNEGVVMNSQATSLLYNDSKYVTITSLELIFVFVCIFQGHGDLTHL